MDDSDNIIIDEDDGAVTWTPTWNENIGSDVIELPMTGCCGDTEYNKCWNWSTETGTRNNYCHTGYLIDNNSALYMSTTPKLACAECGNETTQWFEFNSGYVEYKTPGDLEWGYQTKTFSDNDNESCLYYE